MVANIRCGEIAADQLQALQQDQAWLSLSQDASAGIVPGFGGHATALISSALSGLLRLPSMPCMVRFKLVGYDTRQWWGNSHWQGWAHTFVFMTCEFLTAA